MLCLNFTSRTSNVAAHDGSRTLVCGVVREDQLILASDDDVRGSIRRLRAFKASGISDGEFKLRQTACGFNLQESSVLCDPELDAIVKPCSQFCHDWMHGIFSHGVWNVMIFLLMVDIAAINGNIWKELSATLNCGTVLRYIRRTKPICFRLRG